MIFNKQPQILWQQFGLTDERARQLHDFLESCLDVLEAQPSFTTADICSMLAPRINTPEEGFYVAWITYQTLTETCKK